jgi:hypothetical protein
MSILERLDALEDNALNEPFKYSRKKTTSESKEIAELKEIIGILPTEKNTQVRFGTNI